jgi:hypothetical protein
VATVLEMNTMSVTDSALVAIKRKVVPITLASNTHVRKKASNRMPLQPGFDMYNLLKPIKILKEQKIFNSIPEVLKLFTVPLLRYFTASCCLIPSTPLTS